MHWDGKLLPEITGANKVDRLPIVITHEDTEQLIAVPKLKSGTGDEIAKAVFDQLNGWQLINKVQGICFDTTAANTGATNGAAILFEQKIGRDLMYLPCRHHIFEIVLKEVFLKKVLNSTTAGPNIPLFDRFKNNWHTFDPTLSNTGFTDGYVRNFITSQKAEEIRDFCLNQLSIEICRDDYKEFLELVVVFLGFDLPKGNKFRKPGASHHARWMSKAIYSLKIFIFRDQFNISTRELGGIRDVCIFLVLLYVEAWFRSSLSFEAPNNDFQFILSSIDYANVDPVISDIILKKMSNHLWYLGSENIGMSFFDENISIDDKREMVAALNTRGEPCKKFVATPNQIQTLFPSKKLSHFVSSATKNFFQRFDICTDFLNTDPTSWSTNIKFNIGLNKCRCIKVVNDSAERFVQLFTNYNLILTKDESQKQYLLQVVKDYSAKYPTTSKSKLI